MAGGEDKVLSFDRGRVSRLDVDETSPAHPPLAPSSLRVHSNQPRTKAKLDADFRESLSQSGDDFGKEIRTNVGASLGEDLLWSPVYMEYF
jgi:hypothetical protein